MQSRLVLFWIITVFSSTSLLAAPVKLLVKNARLFTMAPQQREPFTGYLTVAGDGTIVTVAKGDPPPGLKAVRVIDAGGDWIIPGFISAHSHLWQAAYRGLAADQTLLAWIDDVYNRRALKSPAQDFYWFCLLGSLDHLQHGITAAYDFNYSRTNQPDSPFDEAQFRAELKSGIRFVHGYEPGWMAPGVTLSQERERLKQFLD